MIMKRAIITVTESPSMLGRYTVKCDTRRNRGGFMHPADVGGEHAAAAKAMEYAVDAGGGYVIFAPKKVIDLIPEDMRSRG
jgi:hypothetical protein